MNLSTIDIAVIIGYVLLLLGVALYIIRKKKREKEETSSYFLAGKSLTWWIIGPSVIASNISAEQFIGMSGSGYAIGLGIATYEWIGALGLLLVAKFFLPIYLKEKIYTLPQFLEVRYSKDLKVGLAFFWLFIYCFVNIPSVLYLGGLVVEQLLNVPLFVGILILALLSGSYAILGGLKAIATTDVIQVIFLVIGGLCTTYVALDALDPNHAGVLHSLVNLYHQVPNKFDLILSKNDPNYKYLPGIGVLLGGLWIANIAYFGCNQYIVQRSLAAKSLKEAQWGMSFAAFLKLLIPLIVVIPGIAAFALHADIGKSDNAYPWLLANLVPSGIRGLSFAALIAAVVSSLSSMANSLSTIFAMDLCKYFRPQYSEAQLVKLGKVSIAVSLVIALVIAPSLAHLDQVFQFIQDFTGWISPGIVVLFLFGLFWHRSTIQAARWVMLLTLPISALFYYALPQMAFIDRMGWSAILLSCVMLTLSIMNRKENTRTIRDQNIFKTDWKFNLSSILVISILTLIYTLFW